MQTEQEAFFDSSEPSGRSKSGFLLGLGLAALTSALFYGTILKLIFG